MYIYIYIYTYKAFRETTWLLYHPPKYEFISQQSETSNHDK